MFCGVKHTQKEQYSTALSASISNVNKSQMFYIPYMHIFHHSLNLKKHVMGVGMRGIRHFGIFFSTRNLTI